MLLMLYQWLLARLSPGAIIKKASGTRRDAANPRRTWRRPDVKDLAIWPDRRGLIILIGDLCLLSHRLTTYPVYLVGKERYCKNTCGTRSAASPIRIDVPPRLSTLNLGTS